MNNTLFTSYIEAKVKKGWTPASVKSESARLRKVLEHVNGDAEALWAYVSQTQAPYTRLTTWSRVSDYWQWLMDKGHVSSPTNPYKVFRKESSHFQVNAVYKPKELGISLEEARARIEMLSDGGSRALALQLLGSGCRYSEFFTLKDGIVQGKGRKLREVYVPDVEGPAFDKTYRTFLNHLKAVGLTPHMLRKLAATAMHDAGLNEFDLLKAFGWESVETAKRYIQPKNNEKLRELFKETLHGSKKGKRS